MEASKASEGEMKQALNYQSVQWVRIKKLSWLETQRFITSNIDLRDALSVKRNHQVPLPVARESHSMGVQSCEVRRAGFGCLMHRLENVEDDRRGQLSCRLTRQHENWRRGAVPENGKCVGDFSEGSLSSPILHCMRWTGTVIMTWYR